ncbi:universal stress protein UspA [Pseudomonas endophytica]|uniref:Universal stress protein UspA n=1 Tax=Pseudomonas endophytica TaxID=1563157 RepID=A0A0Q0SQF4_9PSED|nr:universal stress protein [Pseudomonas endophytica]KQB54199.1 universal stress protein UspA [Pseudomonas endophytica]
MQTIRSYLVVIEPQLMESLALKRAKEIASITQAHLHLLISDKEHDHTALLDVLTGTLKNEGYSVTSRQAWHENLHTTIIKEQQIKGCGLVIKQHVDDSTLRKILLTPEDWKLLRDCPAPVLLVRTSQTWKNSVALAAIDVGNGEEAHMALHKKIIDRGLRITSLTHGELHVVSAHPAPTLAVMDATYPIETEYEASYIAASKEFQSRFDISDERMHVKEGPADIIIQHVAKKLGATVTIIGTVARTGLSAALIGNTAEILIDKLECDILVLKPDDIVEQLEQKAADA